MSDRKYGRSSSKTGRNYVQNQRYKGEERRTKNKARRMCRTLRRQPGNLPLRARISARASDDATFKAVVRTFTLPPIPEPESEEPQP